MEEDKDLERYKSSADVNFGILIGGGIEAISSLGLEIITGCNFIPAAGIGVSVMILAVAREVCTVRRFGRSRRMRPRPTSQPQPK